MARGWPRLLLQCLLSSTPGMLHPATAAGPNNVDQDWMPTQVQKSHSDSDLSKMPVYNTSMFKQIVPGKSACLAHTGVSKTSTSKFGLRVNLELTLLRQDEGRVKGPPCPQNTPLPESCRVTRALHGCGVPSLGHPCPASGPSWNSQSLTMI